MALDVSSSFISQIVSKNTVPNRRFSMGGSDYSDRVLKYPIIRKTAQEVKPDDLTIVLANDDGHFNFFYNKLYSMATSCFLDIGFDDMISDFSDAFSDSSIGGTVRDQFNDNSINSSYWGVVTENNGTVIESATLQTVTASADSDVAFAWYKTAIDRTKKVTYKFKIDALTMGGVVNNFLGLREYADNPYADDTEDADVLIFKGVESDTALNIYYLDTSDVKMYWSAESNYWVGSEANAWTSFNHDTDYNYILDTNGSQFRIFVLSADELTIHINTNWVNWSDARRTSNYFDYIELGESYDDSPGGPDPVRTLSEHKDFIYCKHQNDGLWSYMTKGGTIIETSALDIVCDTITKAAFLWYKKPIDDLNKHIKTKFRINTNYSDANILAISEHANGKAWWFADADKDTYLRVWVYADIGNTRLIIRYLHTDGDWRYWDGSANEWTLSIVYVYESFAENTDYYLVIEKSLHDIIIKLKDSTETTTYATTDAIILSNLKNSGNDLFFVVGNQLTDVNRTDLTIKEILFTKENYIPMFKGFLKKVTYSKEKATLRFKDKMWELGERVIGDTDVPVTFTSVIPSDIAWTLLTCYAPYNSTADSSNPDIDYLAYEAWSSVFSEDSVLASARYEGMKVSQALSILAKMTESAIWAEGDGKIKFERFSTASSNDAVFTEDHIKDLIINLDDTKLVNKQFVYSNYSVSSDYFLINVFDESSVSVNSFGLREDIMMEKSFWYVNSASALTIAQRKTLIYAAPLRNFDLTTMLGGVYRQIGETIRFNDNFLGITSEESWRIMGYNFNVDKGEVKYNLDGATVLQGFYLDTDKLDSEARIL